MVGARGFEPPTPCAQDRCATRLRYAPTISQWVEALKREWVNSYTHLPIYPLRPHDLRLFLYHEKEEDCKDRLREKLR
jgi:hypothetical protein